MGWRWQLVGQRHVPGAALALACLVAGPALASIVPSAVPPEPPPAAPAPTAPPPAAAPPAAAAPPIAPPAAAAPPAGSDMTTPASIATPHDTPPPGWTTVPDGAPPAGAGLAPGAPTDTVTLERPDVPDTGRLVTPIHSVNLYGVSGLSGDFATSLHGAIAADGGTVTCHPEGGAYRCLLADGTDVAALALRNGAAQAGADAPASYQQLEAQARDERRGVWASLPPPPVRIEHPGVVDTATLTAGAATYRLSGITGLGGPYARDLQAYIRANGDWLSCSQQGEGDQYICLLQGQTDLAKLALVNGAARVATDAPDSYRAEQADALANRRGYWKNPPPSAVAAARAAPVVSAPPLPVGDDGGDGVRYVGGAPAATIDGQTVFLMFAGAAGWGYWDHHRRWHRAPPRYDRHMERFHPGGRGLAFRSAPPHRAPANIGFRPRPMAPHFIRPPAMRQPGHRPFR